ncbi:hypothetical protein PROFUN_10768 [Planoprotostelium fungivorum]|uniref:Uncharacterized protein n=1 Tax=Planoprotostelium fungivorum TaxID=1890364 RepID=A0A2P6N812_9EUKA|nr:hypothetical protein PROFUN_10768 [Planoprotostelium fungivorum]
MTNEQGTISSTHSYDEISTDMHYSSISESNKSDTACVEAMMTAPASFPIHFRDWSGALCEGEFEISPIGITIYRTVRPFFGRARREPFQVFSIRRLELLTCQGCLLLMHYRWDEPSRKKKTGVVRPVVERFEWPVPPDTEELRKTICNAVNQHLISSGMYDGVAAPASM